MEPYRAHTQKTSLQKAKLLQFIAADSLYHFGSGNGSYLDPNGYQRCCCCCSCCGSSCYQTCNNFLIISVLSSFGAITLSLYTDHARHLLITLISYVDTSQKSQTKCAFIPIGESILVQNTPFLDTDCTTLFSLCRHLAMKDAELQIANTLKMYFNFNFNFSSSSSSCSSSSL